MAVPVGSEYDVFLSFRGPDTRLTITDVLYEFMTDKGIFVFRDDEEIHRGEEIGGELERAIRCSRVYVVVFSTGYASSAWCLRELAMMVDCCRDSSSRKIILPIFFDVVPYDVKLRTTLYRGALDKHGRSRGEEEVKRWEEALVNVGRISGWDYKGDMGLGKLARFIVLDVLRYLKIRDRSLPPYLVGMDDRVESVMTRLNCESHDVRIVMLHGMGGIGKTTLADAIFNKISSQFDGCSFLGIVRASSTGEEGVIKLQKNLLVDILGRSVVKIRDSNDGRNQIKTRLSGKKVLLVFDDVSERHQLDELIGTCDFFGDGTRVIVTTRDSSVCKGLMRSSDIYAYEMEGMGADQALKLFNHHAFGEEGPPDNFVALSKQIIGFTGNLPLALTVIGRHLFGKEKEIWEDTLKDLDRVPYKDVMRILRISYEGLEDSEQQIFLDIACFDNYAMPGKYASYMWKACNLQPKLGLDVLQDRSLIKVINDDDDQERYWMHDLIREMGREIVRSESRFPHSPGMRSRLWDPKEARNVIRQKEGSRHVLAIRLGSLWNRHSFTGEEFQSMSNLRFLYLEGEQLTGEFRNFRKKLLWLHWIWLQNLEPDPTFLKMDSLVVLQISGEGITDDSMKNLRMRNLRVLDVRHARIRRMPDLSHSSKLEIIVFRDCGKLEKLDSSINVLMDLKCLKIKGCMHLTGLSKELGSAKALEKLILIDCGLIRELPEYIGNLRNLKILRGIRIEISKLPSSIGDLKRLEVLEIEGSSSLDEVMEIKRYSSSYGTSDVSNLARCNLSGLSCLRSLTLSGLDDLGESLELPSSLTKLRVVHRSRLLFSNLSSLTNLAELELQGTCAHSLGVGKLHRLQILKLDFKGNRVRPSTELGSLSKLEELYLNSSDISSISQLPSSLRDLTLTGLRTGVQWVRYSNLQLLHRLYLSCSSLSKIQLEGLDNMGNLSYVTLENCIDIELSDLVSVRRLCSLHLVECGRIDFSGVERMELLEELIVRNCFSLQRIPDLSGLRRLKVHFVGCYPLQSVLATERRRRSQICRPECAEIS